VIADAKRRGLTNQQATDEFNEKGMPPTGSGGGRQLRCGNAASTWRGGPCVRGRSRVARRRLDCPYIFHRDGRPLGDFRKPWKTACKAAGLDGRIVHDLRRSGVRHLINTGNDPHVVMAFSGHRTRPMLRRYDIINVDDLRRAAQRGSTHRGESAAMLPLAKKNP